MYRVLGWDEAVNTCDCCRKSDLKGTFAVERGDGEILHFGSVCVTRHTGKAAKVVRKEAKDATEDRRKTAEAELRAHPAVLADRARMEYLHRHGVPDGMRFVDAHRDEWIAADAARQQIAAKHGFKSYELHA
jgi:hypothetical protein